MSYETRQRAEEIVRVAITLDPAKRSAFVDTSCADNDPLREEVASLMQELDAPSDADVTGVRELGEGDVLAHFRLTGSLGRGGMGVVHRGIDLTLDREVAIKVLPPADRHQDESVARFLREAKIASKLHHPSIPTIFEFGVEGELRYLVMELVQGRTLSDLLKQEQLSIRRLLEIGIQIASALDAAHQKGIVHRDIKPSNIMLTDQGQVKILDFGLAKMSDRPGMGLDSFQTLPGQVMGTVSYMSPEQARASELDARTDIFSTGVVLFEMVTGRRPFTGNAPSIILSKILNEVPPPVSDLRADAPPALDRVVGRCLEKDRHARYTNALGLAADLRPILHDLTGDDADLMIGTSGSATVSPAPASRARASTPGDRPPATRRPATAATPRGGVAAPHRQAPPASALMGGARRSLGLLLSSLRWVITAAGSIYTLMCLARFALPLVREEVVAGSVPVGWLRVLTDRPVAWLSGLVSIDLSVLRVGAFDFVFVGLAIATAVIQRSLAGRLERLEFSVLSPLLQPPAVFPSHPLPSGPVGAASSAGGSRRSLLREYAAARQSLSMTKKALAFLSIEVAESARMKQGEEKLAVEHAFEELEKFLTRTCDAYHAYRLAPVPDGIIACFTSVDDAVAAGRKVLDELAWFNDGVHELRSSFALRCGLHFGDVLVPDDKSLNQVADEVIDLTTQLRRRAGVNSLWLSGDAYDRLRNRDGILPSDGQVANHDVFIWQHPDQPA